jgi:hypothetical protein
MASKVKVLASDIKDTKKKTLIVNIVKHAMSIASTTFKDEVGQRSKQFKKQVIK